MTQKRPQQGRGIVFDLRSIQVSSVVPAGSYSFSLANMGGTLLPNVQRLLQAVGRPQYVAVADYVSLSDGTPFRIAGKETLQFDSRVGLWSQHWKGLANYNWWFAAQKTTVASLWTIEATVLQPTHAQELVYWFCIGGMAIRSVIEEKQSSGAVTWLLPTSSS